MVQRHKTLLHIGACSHFGRAAHQNANCTAANFSEKFRLAGIGVRFMDEGNFCFGDSALDQLCFHVIVDIENARLGRRQIAENKLRTALRHGLLPYLKNFAHTDIDLAVRIVGQVGVDQALIQRQLASVVGDFQHIVLIGLYHFIADFVGPFAQFCHHLLLYFGGL